MSSVAATAAAAATPAPAPVRESRSLHANTVVTMYTPTA